MRCWSRPARWSSSTPASSRRRLLRSSRPNFSTLPASTSAAEPCTLLAGGAESIETALKLARQYQVEIGQPTRYQVISRNQSYHGSTLGALSVSGNKKRREIYLPMVRESAHVGIP
jgi:adenosylmethionine-8-amino-7-oxononanoate aminotransferase